MAVLDVCYWAICLVLVTSGAMKVADPEGFAAFVEPVVGSSRSRSLSRVVGGWELALGFLGIAFGGALVSALVAVTYAVFFVVVIVALRRELPSCGCFGSSSAPPSGSHALVNAVSVVVAVVAVARATPGLFDGLRGWGWWAVPAVVAVLIVAVSVVVVDTKPVGATFLRRSTHGGIDERSKQGRI